MALHGSNTGSEFHRRWSPRVGEPAIGAYINRSRYLLLAWCSWWLGAMPFYYIHIESPHQRFVWVPLLGFGIGGAVLWVLALTYSSAYRKLVGQHFGIRLGFGDAPTLRYEAHFDYWCHIHGIGPGSIVVPRFSGPSSAFLRTLGVIAVVLTLVCFVGLVVPGVPTSQRPGWAAAVLAFGFAAAALVHLAAKRPPGVSRGDIRRAFGRQPVE